MRLQKGIILLLAIAISILLIACGDTKSGGNNYVFRAGDWGDSRESILELDDEIDPIIRDSGFDSDILWGKTTLNGCDAKFAYYFTDDKLTNGLYTFDPNFTDATRFINLYETVKESLTNVYGKPSYSEIRPIKKNYAGENVEDPTALEDGYVIYNSIFETQKSDIMLSLRSEDHEITLIIFYTHVDYYDGVNGSNSN